MIRFSFSDIFKFLIGILLVQMATGILVVASLRTDNKELLFLFLLLALTLCLLTAFWFASLISHAKRYARAQLQEGFSREREKIRLQAEREKSKVIQKSHQRIIRDRNRTQTKANIKTGTMFAGVLALGGIMAFTQFFTFGLLLMASAGGALGGYMLRSRQLRAPGQQKLLFESNKKLERFSRQTPRE